MLLPQGSDIPIHRHVRQRLCFLWGGFRNSPRFKLIRYAFAGAAISVGYTLTVVLLVDGLHWLAPALASAVSFALWTPVAYWVHRDFTFLFTVASGQATAIIKFIVSFVFRLAAAAYIVEAMAGAFGSRYLVGVLANWLILPLISYLIMDAWVFRAPSAGRSAGGPTL